MGLCLYNFQKKRNYIEFNSDNTLHSKQESKHIDYPILTHHNNITNLKQKRNKSKKKVRFVETQDFIYYDPQESPRDLRK